MYSSGSDDIGFFVLLTISFIVLKLLGYIEWSWLWVLVPLWGPIVSLLILLVIVLIIDLLIDATS